MSIKNLLIEMKNIEKEIKGDKWTKEYKKKNYHENIFIQKEKMKRMKEEERRRKLLEEVASALQENESTNVSAGSEGVITYEYEEELD